MPRHIRRRGGGGHGAACGDRDRGSSGIGLAIARVLGEEGYALTVAARRPEKLEEAAAGPARQGLRGQVRQRQPGRRGGRAGGRALPPRALRAPGRAGQQRRRRHRRGGRRADDQEDRHPARAQPALADPLLPRGVELLRAAGAEHRNALVVNTASISGKAARRGCRSTPPPRRPWSASPRRCTRSSAATGIKSTALCPAFVDTPMTDFVKEQVKRRGHDPGLTTSPRPCASC